MVRGGLSSALALLTRVTELRAPVTSPCYHPPSHPRRLCHPHLHPCCCSPYLWGRGGEQFFWGCSSPSAPHPF